MTDIGNMIFRSSRYRYILAVAIPILAVIIRLVFFQSLLGTKVPYVVLYPAVIFVALYGGIGPALLSSLVSVMLADYFWIEPLNHLFLYDVPGDLLGSSIFLITCTIMIIAIDRMHKAVASAVSAEAKVKLLIDHKESEKALYESNERLKLAQKSAKAGLWDWDMVTGKLEWSEELFNLFGLDPKEKAASFDSWGSVIHHEDREIAKKRIEEAVGSHSILNSEYRILTPLGEERWINAIGDTIYDDQNKALRMSGICIDVTQRKDLENMLQSKLNEQEVMLASSPAMIFYKDKENHFIRVNRTFEKTMGIPREDLEGKSLFDIYPKELADTYWKDDLEVIETGRAKCGIVESMQTAQGTRRVETDKIPYFDDRGRIKGIIGFAIDITEREKLEDELRKYNENLESMVIARSKEVINERQRLYDLLETLPVYVVLLDRDYRVPFANKFFRERFGDSYGKRCYEYLFKRDSECENCETYKVMKTGMPHHWEWLGPDGRNYDIYDFPFKDNDGSSMIMEMGIDVTAQKLAVDELINTRAELDRAKRLYDIGLLAATVAHELRNPLAAIGIATHNIRRKANNPDLDKNLANIDKKVAESDRIISNLLFYSRIKSPQYEKINMFNLVEECVEEFSRKVKKELNLVKDTRSIENDIIEADPFQLKEVFSNILDNAYDAIPAEKGEIKIISNNEDKYINICIEDNGCGIGSDIVDKIFDPFFTTKANGTGLGLPVCRQIVNMHGGEIGVRNDAEKGTSIFIRLPKERKKERKNKWPIST